MDPDDERDGLHVFPRHMRQPMGRDGSPVVVPDADRVNAARAFLRGLLATLDAAERAPEVKFAPPILTRVVQATEAAATAWADVPDLPSLVEATGEALDMAIAQRDDVHPVTVAADLLAMLSPAFDQVTDATLADLLERWRAARSRTRGRPPAGTAIESTSDVLHALLVAAGLTVATSATVHRARSTARRGASKSK